MLKNVVNMHEVFSIVLFFATVNLVNLCLAQLSIVRVPASNGVGSEMLNNSRIRITAGTNLTLTCMLRNKTIFYNNDKLLWGRRGRTLKFRGEPDLVQLAKNEPELFSDILYSNETYQPSAVKNFLPIRLSDAGAHFCMSLNNSLFKIVYIEVHERVSCLPNKFECINTHHCISLHYMCDGKKDCFDGSDESYEVCRGNPCKGKIYCEDGRCIPTSWCCNKKTDSNCSVNTRPNCCPSLSDPYDPLIYYNSNNNEDHVEIERKGASSRYVFIIICVISGVFSFIIFLCIISRMCNLDSNNRQSRLRDTHNQSVTCTHSDCVLRRQVSPNFACIYLATVNSLPSITSDNNNGVDDPLMMSYSSANDQPPPYAEVVKSPISINKFGIDEICPPPPPYASTNIFNETDVRNVDNTGASQNEVDFRTVNSANNRNIICDNVNVADRV